MPYFLGIDTSNYTTSAAIYSAENGIVHKKMLLPVKQGECGLRQSDAVFHHVRQLPLVISSLLEGFEGDITDRRFRKAERCGRLIHALLYGRTWHGKNTFKDNAHTAV